VKLPKNRHFLEICLVKSKFVGPEVTTPSGSNQIDAADHTNYNEDDDDNVDHDDNDVR